MLQKTMTCIKIKKLEIKGKEYQGRIKNDLEGQNNEEEENKK